MSHNSPNHAEGQSQINPEMVRAFLVRMKSQQHSRRISDRFTETYAFDDIQKEVVAEMGLDLADTATQEALKAARREARSVYWYHSPDVYGDTTPPEQKKKNELTEKMRGIRAKLTDALPPAEELAILEEMLDVASARGYLRDPDPTFDMIATRNLVDRMRELRKQLGIDQQNAV